ncbi:MAG: carboxymuconolactone decarboxylase family protein [Clostridium sp.]|nr:carboxymuconolactone decarboxylase family protein [Clostridium sp.]
MIKQTAGRDKLGDFAPNFAHYNDDILFGENWNDKSIDLKTRCIITVVALMSSGITDSSLIYHLENAKKNGVTKDEMVGIITHTAFYVGWPKGWAVFNLLKEIYKEDEVCKHGGIFGLGEPNDAYAKYFIGKSYLNFLSKTDNMSVANVTFEPGCRNNWHIHKSTKDGGQILVCVDGEGWYQEEGKEARSLKPGDVVTIPANVKHWHGAKKDSWFSHLAVEVPGENTSNEWLEEVNEEYYDKLD